MNIFDALRSGLKIHLSKAVLLDYVDFQDNHTKRLIHCPTGSLVSYGEHGPSKLTIRASRASSVLKIIHVKRNPIPVMVESGLAKAVWF